MLLRTIIFLIINFAALGLGSLFTSNGVDAEWYTNLNKAPWTPPGWVFGAAWTTIMICFAFYAARVWGATENQNAFLLLFGLQWVLNVAWNPVFFKFNQELLALVIIISLTILIGYLLFNYFSIARNFSWLLLPYFVWLLIASSLNFYILLKN